jgi:hypothetical protein
MASEMMFRAELNPLQLPEAEIEPQALTLEIALQFLCARGLGTAPQDLSERYREIDQGTPRLFAAPSEEHVLEKLIWPLRHAKAGYMLGNHLGTVALCGMVAEMIALLLFELAEVRVNNQPITEEQQRALFGSPFERLRQDRRVEVLKAYGLVTGDQVTAFGTLRAVRRKYLHFWSQEHASIAQDSIEAFRAAVRLVVSVVGQESRDGKMVLQPALLRFLEKKGLIVPAPPSGASA